MVVTDLPVSDAKKTRGVADPWTVQGIKGRGELVTHGPWPMAHGHPWSIERSRELPKNIEKPHPQKRPHLENTCKGTARLSEITLFINTN